MQLNLSQGNVAARALHEPAAFAAFGLEPFAVGSEARCRPVQLVETGVDTERLTQRMLDAGWLLAPGHLFHVEKRPSTLMRINFASSQDAKFWRALGKVCGAV